jgi:hypothetical protein
MSLKALSELTDENDLGEEIYNLGQPSEDWFIHLTGLNHNALYTYWIEIWVDANHDGSPDNYDGNNQIADPKERVFDTRPILWVDNQGMVCAPGSPNCHDEPVLRDPRPCVVKPNDNLTCFDSDSDMPGIQEINYDEPNVPTTFKTDPIAPYIVYAFADVHATNADIVALIDHLPPNPANTSQEIYEVWIVYWEQADLNRSNRQEEKMALQTGDAEWKIHLSDLQINTGYVYQVEVRTNIPEGEQGDGGDQPKEVVALKDAIPVVQSTEYVGLIDYYDRDGSPIQRVCAPESGCQFVDPPIAVGQALVADGTFYLKLDLKDVPEFSRFAELKLTWPGVSNQPTFVYGQEVDSDPLSPGYRTVVFEISTSQFPKPDYHLDLDGTTIVPDPPVFEVNYELRLRGSGPDGKGGELVDGGDFQIQNVPPVIKFQNVVNGNLVELSNCASDLNQCPALPDAIALAHEYGPGGGYDAFRTLTLDLGGVDWPSTLQLISLGSLDTDLDDQPIGTYQGQVGEDGKIVFLVPIGFYQVGYVFTLNPPGDGQDLVYRGLFEVPNSRAPEVSLQTLLTNLSARYAQVSPNPAYAGKVFWLELQRFHTPNITPALVLPLGTFLNQIKLTGGTISIQEQAAIMSSLSASGNMDARITARIAVRELNTSDPNQPGAFYSVAQPPPPLPPFVPSSFWSLSFDLIAGGQPSHGTQAEGKAQDILLAFVPTILNDPIDPEDDVDDYQYQEAAVKQVNTDSGHSAKLRITFRDKNGDCTNYCPNGLLVSLLPDGGIGTIVHNPNDTITISGGLSDQIAILAPLLTGSSPTNPQFVSVTLVELDGDNTVSNKLSETRMWVFGNN